MAHVKNWHKFQHFKDRRPPWIKLYRDLLDDPDWHDLDAKAAKNLVMLWLIASENDGKLPDERKLAFRLRLSLKDTKQLLNSLSHWLGQDDFEPISDRYHDDTPERETERETETQEKTETDLRAVAEATRPADRFDDFWKAYPKRDGANPKEPARKKFTAAVKAGADAETIISAAVRYAREMREKQQFGTPYVAQAVTWLNQQRWGDYQPTAPPMGAQAPAGAPSDEELRERYGKLAEDQKSQGAGVLPPGGREDSGGGGGVCDQPRNAGIRSLGAVLQSAGLAPVRDGNCAAGHDQTGDDADPLAGMVRH